MKKLGELLVEREWLTRDQLTQALRHQQVFGGRLGTCLLELTLLSEDRLTKALSDQAGVPPATVDDLRVIPDGLLEQVPVKLACRVRAIPFERFGNALSIAVIDARDLVAQDELAFVTSKRLKVHVAPEVRVLEALEKHYSCPIEPRYARIWDRLNRAKYLWQEETGARQRPTEPPPAPSPAPVRAASSNWDPSPPPPLEMTLREAPPPAPAHVALEPPPPEAPPKRKRWLFGRGKSTEVKPPPDMVTPVSAPPVAATPEPATPRPAAPRVAFAPPPAAAKAAPPAAAARTAPSAAAIPPPPAAAIPPPPAAIPPRVLPPAPVATRPQPTARRVEEDRETLPPAPTPTPLAERAAPGAPAEPVAATTPVAVEREASDTTPVIVPKRAATLEELDERIGEVERRDDVAHAALSFFSLRFHRTLLFMVRGDTVAAWMGSGDNLDQRLFGEVEVTFGEPSLFLNLREGSPFYRGPLPRLDTHQRIVRAWGGRYPKECLLLPVRIKKRLVAVVYLDGANEDLGGADLGELQKAAGLLGRGLESFLAKRKRA